MSKIIEKEYISRYLKGDIDALGQLVEQTQRPLYSFIIKMTEGRGDADEIFQEVWTRAIRNLQRFKTGNFMGWLFRIAHNCIIDSYRMQKKNISLQDPGTDEIELEQQLSSPTIKPDDEAADHDLGEKIQSAVQTLPDSQREVFLMRTEADLPFKEIARIQKTSVNTVLGRMHYAVERLRTELHDEWKQYSGEVSS